MPDFGERLWTPRRRLFHLGRAFFDTRRRLLDMMKRFPDFDRPLPSTKRRLLDAKKPLFDRHKRSLDTRPPFLAQFPPTPMSSRDGLLDSDVDLVRLGALIAQARREARMTQAFLANKVGASDRTLSRWETGTIPPSVSQLKGLIALLGKADPGTLEELRRAGHLQPKLTPVPTVTTLPTTPQVDAHAALDELVRLYAEDLDISARRLRAALALLLADLERLGVPLSTAREMITHSPKRRI